jgi:hypothetical protein
MPSNYNNKWGEIALELEGSKITAKNFRTCINNFFDMVDEVVTEYGGSKNSVVWLVDISPGSAKILLRPDMESSLLAPNQTQDLMSTITNGLELIENTGVKPEFFTEKALRKIATLSSTIGEEIASIKVGYNGRAGSLTRRSIANVDTLLKTNYQDWGSVEGYLREISGKKTNHASVYEEISGKYIKCEVSWDKLLEMIPAFGKRVMVSGVIHYTKEGEIQKILVEDFEIFPEPEKLPNYNDVYGILGRAD